MSSSAVTKGRLKAQTRIAHDLSTGRERLHRERLRAKLATPSHVRTTTPKLTKAKAKAQAKAVAMAAKAGARPPVEAHTDNPVLDPVLVGVGGALVGDTSTAAGTVDPGVNPAPLPGPPHLSDKDRRTPAEWARLRQRVIREEKYCRRCLEARGVNRPNEIYRAEASEVAWVDAGRGLIRPNLIAVCEPCAVRWGHLTKDSGWVEGNAEVRLVEDPREALVLRTEVHDGPDVLGHRLMAGDTQQVAIGTNATKLERRVEALRLRQQGCDYRTILAELRQMGFECSIRQVHDDVNEALTEFAKMEGLMAEEILELELSRLDVMFMAVWPDIQRGDVFAIQTGLKVMERRSKYLGLDRATEVKVDAMVGMNKPRPLGQLADSELHGRAAQLMRRFADTQPVIDTTSVDVPGMPSDEGSAPISSLGELGTRGEDQGGGLS